MGTNKETKLKLNDILTVIQLVQPSQSSSPAGDNCSVSDYLICSQGNTTDYEKVSLDDLL